MKNTLTLFIALLTLPLAAAVKNGQTAPDFTLADINGKTVSLDDFAGQTVVLEWINTGCPFVNKFYTNGDMPKLQKKAQDMGAVWLTINSTKPQHPQYTSPGESREWAKAKDYAATWLMDPEGKVGKAYGAQTTPHMFVIDAEGKVVYQGAIDSVRDADPSSIAGADNYVMDALRALQSGKEIKVAQSRPYGCSVKY